MVSCIQTPLGGERYESYVVCGLCLVMKESLKATLTGNQEGLLGVIEPDLPAYFL